MGCASSAPEDDTQKSPQHANAQNGKSGESGQGGADKDDAKSKRRLSVAPQHATLRATHSPIVESKDDLNLTPLEQAAKAGVKHALVSRKGLVPYNSSKVNQDRFVFKYALGDDAGISMWGVMDGHGEYGHYVAAFIQEHLPACLAEEKAALRREPEAAITRATAAMCRRLAETDINTAFSGSTLVYGVKIDDQLYVANVGDSRCVLVRQGPNGQPQAIALSTDQKPEREDERARIVAHGGRVEPLPGPPGECGPARVWLAEADVPGLAMSRSVGDEVSQTVGVISVPEISTHTLTSDDIFVIWASDGVWEFLDDQPVVDLVWKHRANVQEAANQLAEESTRCWKQEEEVIDDITVCLVQFNQPK